MQDVTADYLVVGGGAMGMAFTDVLLNESDATIAIVDAHDRPGGHWNDAYPFVRLHQPSAFYGVNSRKLGNDTIDQSGWNSGLYELASGAEVVAYFDQVMREQFLPSGRVQYFPNCVCDDNNQVRSKVTGESFTVEAGKRVDATYMNVKVPSVTPPPYEVADGVSFGPLNELPKMANASSQFAVIGAGKTGMDACLWLLRNHVDPDRIHWVMPRDSWMLDRANIQPGQLSARAASFFGEQLRIVAASETVDDVFKGVSEIGQLLRLDDNIEPTMYRCATVTTAELDQLKRVTNIIRMGHVQSIDSTGLHLDGGDVALPADTLYIDCSADALARRPVAPVFDGDRLALQAVRVCQQVFSAAFIAHVELNFDDEEEKNRLCTVIPHPDNHIDFLRTTLTNAINSMTWGQHPGLKKWLAESRLDGFSNAAEGVSDNPDMAGVAMKAVEKLQQYIAEAEAQGL